MNEKHLYYSCILYKWYGRTGWERKRCYTGQVGTGVGCIYRRILLFVVKYVHPLNPTIYELTMYFGIYLTVWCKLPSGKFWINWGSQCSKGIVLVINLTDFFWMISKHYIDVHLFVYAGCWRRVEDNNACKLQVRMVLLTTAVTFCIK